MARGPPRPLRPRGSGERSSGAMTSGRRSSCGGTVVGEEEAGDAGSLSVSDRSRSLSVSFPGSSEAFPGVPCFGPVLPGSGVRSGLLESDRRQGPCEERALWREGGRCASPLPPTEAAAGVP